MQARKTKLRFELHQLRDSLESAASHSTPQLSHLLALLPHFTP